MLENPAALTEFQKILADHGAKISALSCHGNPLHPDKEFAQQNKDVSRKTILLAEKLGVSVVVDFSGCPGDSPTAIAPNWVTCPWPPDYRKILEWQWNEVVAPFWTASRQVRRGSWRENRRRNAPRVCGLQPGDDAAAALHRRTERGCNFDPSHLFWQRIDPIAAIRVLEGAIFHVHAKDMQLHPDNLPRTGVLDTKPYTEERERAWIFRTCGYGHGAEWWRQFVSALRMYGYDSVISIEHEDTLLSPEEGLTKAANFLNGIVIREQAGAAWWA